MSRRVGVICIVILVIIGGIVGGYFLFKESNAEDALRFKNDYEKLNPMKDEAGEYLYDQLSIDEKNKIVYLTYSELLDFTDSGTGIVYFGRPACPWCRKLVPILLDFAKDKNVYIYYYDIENDRSENNKRYKKILELFDEYLPVDTVTQNEEDKFYDENLKRVVLPQLFFIKDGEVKAELMAYQHETLIKKEDDKMKALLLEKYNAIK